MRGLNMPIQMRLDENGILVVNYDDKHAKEAISLAMQVNKAFAQFINPRPDSSFTPFQPNTLAFPILPRADREELQEQIENFNKLMQKSGSLTLFESFKSAIRPSSPTSDQENEGGNRNNETTDKTDSGRRRKKT